MNRCRCAWKPCLRKPHGFSPYCEEHAEEARRNVLRTLGLGAPRAFLWRDGDEEWMLDGVQRRDGRTGS